MSSVPDALREARTARGLTQQQAAELSLIARETYNRAENGRHVSVATMQRIARGLRVPLGALVRT